jgi:hypothetical protein
MVTEIITIFSENHKKNKYTACGKCEALGRWYCTLHSRTRLQRHERDRIFCVVITEECNVMVNSVELIGTTEYLTIYTRCRINRCRYNRVRMYFKAMFVRLSGAYKLPLIP